MRLTFTKYFNKPFSIKVTAKYNKEEVYAEAKAVNIDILKTKEEDLKNLCLERLPSGKVTVTYFENGKKIERKVA